MRPPRLAHSWLVFSVVTSLLMTSSSLLMAQAQITITIDASCPNPPLTCKIPTPVVEPTGNKYKCDPGYALESFILEGSDSDFLPNNDPKLKVACYSKCDKKFRKDLCPIEVSTCDKPIYASKKLKCKQGKELVVNNKLVANGELTCDVFGWKDAQGTVINFSNKDDHFIVSFCRVPLASLASTACHPTDSLENECTDCPTHTFVSNKLSCPDTSKLMYRSRLLDHATCDQVAGWWLGFDAPTASGDKLIDLSSVPIPKMHFKCHDFCSDSIMKEACPGVDPIKCKITDKKINCGQPNRFLKIGDTFYKKATCSKDGWKADTQSLIDFNKNPFEKIQPGVCEPCSSMFENNCPSCTQKPSYTDATNTLACPANHYLIVNDDDDKPKKPLICSVAGWKEGTATILPYTTTIVKLKAKCLSRCDIVMVDTSCTQPCSKPIYLNEDRKLLCRSADEQLVLNSIEVPDVTCDLTKGGWTNSNGSVLVPFSDITSHKVKTSCNPKTLPSTTLAPPAASVGSAGSSTMYIAIIIILSVVIIVGIILVIWLMKRKKKGNSEDEEEGHSKTKTTKSDSKNNSCKNKKGKKGKKGKKSDGKKGKKNKKEKSKKEKVAIDSDVEVPEHQMSMENSTVPLTAAVALVPPAGQNPNVMDI